jgi:hypothetical protein
VLFNGCAVANGEEGVPRARLPVQRQLVEVTAAQENLCKILIEAETGWDGFKRVPNAVGATAKTWLCEECKPDGLELADLLGARVAKTMGGQLFFGEVTEVASIGHATRHLDRRISMLLEQPIEQWRYTVVWPAATSTMSRADVLAARDQAAAIDAHVSAETAALKNSNSNSNKTA